MSWPLPAQEVGKSVVKDQPVSQTGQQKSAEDSQKDAATEEKRATDMLAAIKGIEAALREHIAKEDKAENTRKEKREVEDLAAQKEQALWAKFMFYAAMASAVLSFVGVGLILWNLVYARDLARTSTEMASHAAISTEAAVEAAHSTAEAVRVARQDSRPWLMLRTLRASQFLITKDGTDRRIAIVLHAKIENVGRTVASGVRFHIWPLFFVDYLDNDAEVNSFREDVMKRARGQGAVIPPNEVEELQMTIFKKSAALVDLPEQGGEKFGVLYVLVAVTYRTIDDDIGVTMRAFEDLTRWQLSEEIVERQLSLPKFRRADHFLNRLE